VKNTTNDEKLRDKFEQADKDAIVNKADEILKWLDSNQNAEKEEFDSKQKELEGVVNPIM
jgi:L1 cell adhesion molecule like protein